MTTPIIPEDFNVITYLKKGKSSGRDGVTLL